MDCTEVCTKVLYKVVVNEASDDRIQSPRFCHYEKSRDHVFELLQTIITCMKRVVMLMAFLAIVICINFLPQLCIFEHRPPYASAMHSTEDIAHARS